MMCDSILEWLNTGGIIMYVLTGVGLVLAFLSVERFWATGVLIRSLEGGEIVPRELAPGELELEGLRRLALIRACITIAPLLGLLGTVTGIIETFESNLTGTKGIPREIAFSSQRLFDVLSPAFEPLDVRCLYQPEIPMLDEIVADLQTRLMPATIEDAERKKK